DQPLPADTPDRFVAYMFDDIHIALSDLMRVKQSALRHMDTLARTDRAAIFTTSGQRQLEFTDDRDKLHETLNNLMPHPSSIHAAVQCPDISYYMADLISNKNDPQALNVAAQEVIICNNLDPTDPSTLNTAQNLARGAAQRELSVGLQETRVSLLTIKD